MSLTRYVLALVALAAAVVGLLRSPFAADGFEYAKQVAVAPGPAAGRMLEPGHLFWRPLAWEVTGIERAIPGHQERVRAVQRRMGNLTTALSFVAIVAFGFTAAGLVGPGTAALLGTMFFASIASFGWFIDAPTSYVPGLAFLVLALALAWRRSDAGWVSAAIAGVVLALSAFMWLPFVLVFPAVATGALLLALDLRSGLRRAVILTFASTVVLLGGYWFSARQRGIDSAAGAVAWVGGSSHEIERGGIKSAAIGAVRSVAWVGDGPRVLKRYLAHDRLTPVTRGDLARLWIWPAIACLAIGFGTAVVLAQRRPLGRRLLLLAALAAGPMAWLAISWSGPEVERFLPAMPFVAMVVLAALDVALASAPRPRWALAGLLPLGLVAFLNLVMLSRPVAAARLAGQEARIGCIGPMLTERDIILVPHQADPLRLSSEANLDALPRSAGTEVRSFLPVRPWHGRDYKWSSALRAVADSVLAGGGRVFVPAYVLDSVPPPLADWIEGEYHPVSWGDVRATFAAMRLAPPCEGTGLLVITETR